jgi:hypothetical protein
MPVAKKTAAKTTIKKVAKKTVAAKSVTGKTAKPKSDTGYKYADKSAGQEQLIPIFNELVKLFQPYVKGAMVQRGGKGGQVALVCDKELIIEGRKKTEMHFAAALIQKGYVGFYFMPAYMNPAFEKVFKDTELMKTLKGKACFHIKKLDGNLTDQIKQALKVGHEMFSKKGYFG